MDVWIVAVGALYGLMSLLTLGIFGWDKRAAIRRRRRVPERRLHRLEWLGGWPGALLGMQIFRHKRAKRAYYRVTWAIAVVHLLGAALVGWGMRR